MAGWQGNTRRSRTRVPTRSTCAAAAIFARSSGLPGSAGGSSSSRSPIARDPSSRRRGAGSWPPARASSPPPTGCANRPPSAASRRRKLHSSARPMPPTRSCGSSTTPTTSHPRAPARGLREAPAPSPRRSSASTITRGSNASSAWGGLAPAQLRGLWDERRPLTAADLRLGRTVWVVLRRNDPRALWAIASRGTPAIPPMAAALRRHLQEPPGARNGLSLTERLPSCARSPRVHFGARICSGATPPPSSPCPISAT